MTKAQLLVLCAALGISTNDTMTVAELQALLAARSEQGNVATVAPQQLASATTPSSADAIFRAMDTTKMSTFSGVSIAFIAPSKSGCRLIVRKGSDASTFAVYVFTETVALAGVKVGDVCTILAEQRTSKSDGKLYWNATAISKQ